MGRKRHLTQKVTGPFFNLPPLFLLWLRHGVPQGATKTRPARVNLIRQHTGQSIPESKLTTQDGTFGKFKIKFCLAFTDLHL